jgi:hypothetical protein
MRNRLALIRVVPATGGALFALGCCSGTITFPGQVTVTKTVTISASGHSVVFSGGLEPGNR